MLHFSAPLVGLLLEVPVEEQHSETSLVNPSAEPREAERREARLRKKTGVV